MGKHIKITRGADIKIIGNAAEQISSFEYDTASIKPTDFSNFIPKLVVKVGDEVKAGSPLFYNKLAEHVTINSPVSGEVVDIVRGDKRKLLEVKILCDKQISYIDFDTKNIDSASNEEVRMLLLKSGAWSLIRQRPYDIIANPEDTPKSIFISGFDSNPLAPNISFTLAEKAPSLQKAIDVLKKLTPGSIHVSTKSSDTNNVLKSLKGVEHHTFDGPHPAGNVGIQIHHIDPLSRGEKVWVINPQDLAIIGDLFLEGKLKMNRTIALTGENAKAPSYFTTVVGANISKLVEAQLKDENSRVISGNVFTGNKIPKEGYLGYYHNQITLIPEGNYHEFFGWLSFSPKKISLSRAFTSWLIPSKAYSVDTNKHGEERAFVVSGEYEKYLPIDIYPVQLLKSIITKDIEQMENLGIYEISPEDFALCEFSCTSKINLQEVVQEGIDLMIKEVG